MTATSSPTTRSLLEMGGIGSMSSSTANESEAHTCYVGIRNGCLRAARCVHAYMDTAVPAAFSAASPISVSRLAISTRIRLCICSSGSPMRPWVVLARRELLARYSAIHLMPNIWHPSTPNSQFHWCTKLMQNLCVLWQLFSLLAEPAMVSMGSVCKSPRPLRNAPSKLSVVI